MEVFTEKKVTTCFAATNRVTRGKFDRIQVNSLSGQVGFHLRATYDDQHENP